MPTFDLDGDTIHYTDEGAGQPVLLAHCAGSSSAQWRKLAKLLEDRFRILAIDFYGYGRTSPWKPNRALVLDDEVVLLEVLADRFDEPVHIVGHSYGGAVALKTALALPDRIKTLILIEPVAFWLLKQQADTDRAFTEIEALASAFVDHAALGEADAAAERFVDYWMGQGSWAAMPLERRAPLLACVPKIALEWPAVLNEPTPLAACAHLAQPTLLMRGTKTRLPTHRVVELLRTVLPAHELVEIPGGAHMSLITHAEPVNAAIERHLSANA